MNNAKVQLGAGAGGGAGAGELFWRSLDELANTPQFAEALHREFPQGASEFTDPLSRRRFLKLMGASLALAGVYGCSRQPDEKIVPYVNPPEQVVPGKPLFFATAFPFGGYGTGVLVESHMGRPTKIEGNPDHPASLGATDAFAQSSILQLYDPDRSNVVSYRGNITDWSAFLTDIGPRLEAQRKSGGAGIRILTEMTTSPTLVEQMQQVMQRFPQARWHQYDPISRDNVIEGARQAFGRAMNAVYHFDRAQVIVALDCDFLSCEPGSLRYARDFADKRRVTTEHREMNHLYVIEPTMSITGSMADNRLPLASSRIENLARALAESLGINMGRAANASDVEQHRARAVAEDLRQHAGASVLMAGPQQPPAVHVLVHAINDRLGNSGGGKPISYIEPAEPARAESLRDLVRDMNSGAAELLLILGGNPVYSAPADSGFGDALLRFSSLKRADGTFRNFAVRLGLYNDETSFLCHWHIPQSHYLESWSDIRAYNGTISIIQPLIAPLYRSKSEHELLALLSGQTDKSGYEIVRAYWITKHGQEGFDEFWERALERGVVPNTAAKTVEVQFSPSALSSEPTAAAPAAQPASFEILFRPDPTVWDGSFANIGWQQELPKPFTKLTWDNAALLSPAAAQRLDVKDGGVVILAYHGREVRAPVLVLPGQADDTVTMHLGYGRWRAGRVGSDAGFNAYTLRTSEQPWFDGGLTIRPTDQTAVLAITQSHHNIESRAVGGISTEVIAAADEAESAEHPAAYNRRLVRTATLEQFKNNPDFVKELEPESSRKKPLLTMYPAWKYEGYKWGMSIDLNSCIGCSACIVACQAENNIPIVGREQVARSREMHWIRVDEYFRGPVENPQVFHQPLPCMHCENAPCEVVCPTGATVHDAEGINEMVYNRCIGTRYCSNNCPYKVRRFNFFEYRDSSATARMQKNPDVTVRSRGVMEKCTYCIQRINAARIEAELGNRKIKDGEVVTACQQACPTRAIIFGDLNDKSSEVAALKASPLNYGLLEELTTQPRTTYLPRFTNPNPALTPRAS